MQPKFLLGKIWFLVIVLLPCFLFSKCKKEVPLPEYFFRCKVNGEDYLPNNCANCITADLIGDTTFILGGNRDFEALTVGIQDNDGINEGRYLLNNLDLQNKGGGGKYKNGTLTYDIYKTDVHRIGYLLISSIDKNNKIIQGTFFFKAFNAYKNDTVSITEGKFRLKFHN